MKKYLLLLILPFLFLADVKADTGEGITTINTVVIANGQSEYDFLTTKTNDFYCGRDGELKDNCSYTESFNQLYNYYIENYSSLYPYYVIEGSWDNSSHISLELYFYSDNVNSFNYYAYPYVWYKNANGAINNYDYSDGSINVTLNSPTFAIFGGIVDNDFTYKEYMYFDSNFNIISERDYEIANFYNNNSNLVINIGDKFPKIKDLLNYNSWSDYENNHLENYTTVNLDNYEYVLLSLKNYGNISPFQTNLQVKGQIGITPIYNYGQTSKDAVTGSQVQDRCNVEYSDYTAYPFYIIQSDIQNNAIFAVKSCSSGSSFKFDNTIFDITYITSQNVNNPTININGNTYNVIPYDDLPSTATQNEEDNYIPGQSGYPLNETLDSAIKNAQQKMSEIWDSFTYFTSFIGQIFSSLPSEIHTILISAFIIMIMLGIIKIFLGK